MTDQGLTAAIALFAEQVADYVQSCAEGGSLSDAVQVYDVMAAHIRECLVPDPNALTEHDAALRARQLSRNCCDHCGQDMSGPEFDGHYTIYCHKPGCDEKEKLEADNATLRETLRDVMEHVYSQNDYTTRQYEKYYAAVDKARALLTASTEPSI